MRRSLCLLLALYFSAIVAASSQDLHVPRDVDKLVERLQKFWAATTANQRFRSLEFVLPEKRDLCLSGNPVFVISAKPIGVDFTADPERAGVRMSVQVFAKDVASGALTVTNTDKWVWKDGDWYL